MLRCRLPGIATMLAVVCLSVPQPADAQIGGLIKKKVKEAVKGETSSSTGEKSAAPAGPQFSETVLELTPANLDKLETGLRAEKAYRDSVEAWYAKVKTPEEYAQCRTNAMMSPEAQQLASNADASNLQSAQDAGQKLMALIKKKCGEDPGTLNKNADLRKAQGHGVEASGLSAEAYAVIEERIPPFCGGDGGTAQVQGSGSGIYYVYSETEMAALKPRCEKLMALLSPKPAPAGRRMK